MNFFFSDMPLNFPFHPVAVDYIWWYQQAAPDKLSSQLCLSPTADGAPQWLHDDSDTLNDQIDIIHSIFIT